MRESSGSLRQKIEARYDARATTITLDTTFFGDQIADLLDLINQETITLIDAELTPPAGTRPAPDTWSVAGKATIWSVTDCPFALNIGPGTNDVALVTATGTTASITMKALGQTILPLDPQTTDGLGSIVLTGGAITAIEPDGILTFFATMADGWSPFGLDQIHLERIDFRCAVVSDAAWGRSEKVILTTDLVITSDGKQKTTIPLEVDVPLGGGAWSAGIVAPGVKLNGLSAIAGLLGGDEYVNVIPSQVHDITELQLETLVVLFDPAGPSWNGIDIGISTAHLWPIADKIDVEKVGLRLSVRPGTTPKVTGQVTGRFKVDILEFGVAIPIPLSGTIVISGSSTQPLPGFGAFASLVDAPFAASLPDGVANLGALSINSLYLNYDIGAKTISGVGFQVASGNTWTLIPKYLSLDQLMFGIDASRLSNSWNITGGASGTVIVADIPVSVSVEGGAGTWVIKITQPLNLPSIKELAEMFGGDDSASALPAGFGDGVGALTIWEYEMDFGGTGNSLQHLTLNFGTSEPWKFWDPYFVLESLLVALKVDGPVGTRTLDANIDGVLTITPQVWLVLSAVKPATGPGWTFSGGLAPGHDLAVGDFIAFLLAKFKLTAPPAIASLVLDDLGATFVTDTKAFTFHAAGHFELAGQPSDFAVNFSVNPKQPDVNPKQPGGFNMDVAGDFHIGEAHFKITFDTTRAVLTATWDEANKPIGFAEIAEAFGCTPPAIPEDLDLALSSAGFSYDFEQQRLALQATSVHYGQIQFVTETRPEGRIFLIDLGIHLGVKLSNLPVVGQQIPPTIDVGIESLELTYQSGTTTLTAEDVSSVNTALHSIGGNGLGPATLNPGMAFLGKLNVGGDAVPLSVPATQPPSSQLPILAGPPVAARATASSQPYQAPGLWFDINKNFGPFQLDRIGIQYENSALLFGIDAGLALGPVAFSVQGLAIGSPLKNFSPVVSIAGLGLACNKPPLQISGAILRIPDAQLPVDVSIQFDGTIVLKAEQFSLSAIGSYAQMKSGLPSLFVFAQLETPLGGPPAFFVTGLMAGFGFNRSLVIPGQDEVASFPLLLLAQPPGPGATQTQDPAEVLRVLEGTAPLNNITKQWIKPQAGEYWLAAGLEFTSFEIVRTKAMIVVEFGADLQIALLGLSTMQLPQPEVSPQTYAYIEMMIRVIIQPTQGYFAATAILSNNSYVISKDCHLTGGFAFYLWFGENPNAGQFVVTLGGYHPAFRPLSYYPQVPRVAFNWAVSDVVSIKGYAYFALTPSCAMAGGGLEVQFHDGDLSAWFIAQADFLVSWHPFLYTAHIAVSIGISYRLNLLVCHKTIAVSLGADLELWGPPTGGNLRVDLVVVSFTVHIGSDSAAQETKTPLKWEGFKALLPKQDLICRIAVTGGLYKSAKAPDEQGGDLWVVRANAFSFRTQSAIPASQLVHGKADTPLTDVKGSKINIRPMNLRNVTSVHSLELYKGPATEPEDLSGWSLTSRTGNMPDSLWGAPPDQFTQIPAKPAAEVIPDVPCGIDVAAPAPVIGATRGVVALEMLEQEYLDPGQAPLSADTTPSPDYLPVADTESVALIKKLMDADAKAGRDGLFTALHDASVFTGVNGDPSKMAANAAHLFSESPMVQN
jgi:hypothetical protein